MTTIAYDRVMLAGDRLCNDSGISTHRTKIYEVCDGKYLIGCSGDTQDAVAFQIWADGDFDPEKKPEVEKGFCAIVCERNSDKAFIYENKLFPTLIEDACYAIGSGRDFAWLAMKLGYSARAAVNMTADMDIYTGLGCDMFLVVKS